MSGVEERGFVQAVDEVSKMVYYESSENSMVLEYRGISGHVLFSACEWKQQQT